ncbi:ribosomal protein S7 [Xylariaceae sp. FL1651]|nr:ribosomal protein S7 [Xylariaceae sp. FL1651]
MSSKLSPWKSLRSLAIRTRPSRPYVRPTGALTIRRGLADTPTYPPSDEANVPPQQPLSEAAPNNYVPRPIEPFADNLVPAKAIEALEQAATGEDVLALSDDGLKFHKPERPLKHEQLQDRHHPVIDQLTRLIMRDGKLSKAQRNLSLILNYLRTSPPPKISPLRPLLPGSPPASQLPLNPLLYLTLAIDSVAPIIRVRSMKGMGGGGSALDLPEPLNARSRRRIAIQWIIDIVNKKRSMGSGRTQYATRFGQEIVSVVEGRSAAWDRRQLVHKLGTASRANLAHPNVVGKRRK